MQAKEIQKKLTDAAELAGVDNPQVKKILDALLPWIGKSKLTVDEKSNFYRKIAEHYGVILTLPDLDPFLKYARQFTDKKLTEELADNIFEMLYSLAMLFRHAGKTAKTLEVLSLFESLLDRSIYFNSWYPDLYRFISSQYIRLGDQLTAYQYLTKAVEKATELGKNNFLSNAYSELGCYHIGRNQLPKAIEYFEQAIDLIRGYKDPEDGTPGETAMLNSLGHVYAELGNVEKAKSLFKEVLRSGSVRYGSLANINLAELARKAEDFKKAQKHIEVALQLAEQDNYFYGLYSAKFEMAKLSESQKNYSRAQKIFLELLELITEHSQDEFFQELYESLYSVAKLENNIELALQWHERLFEYERAAYQSKTENRIEEIETRFQVQEMKYSIEKVEREKEIANMKKAQLERELSTTTLQLLAQTELLAEFREGILAVVRKAPPTEPIARELRERLKVLPCKSIDWDKFEAQFKAAHPEFKLKLTELYPDLTKMEVRICTLIRMNLKSPEISRLTCLSERNIENHRYRIRKKMKLEKEQDLGKELNKL